MTGKELKALAAALSDDATITVSMPHPSRNYWESNVVAHRIVKHGDRSMLVLYPPNVNCRPIVGSAQ